jgi:hypothetical protein
MDEGKINNKKVIEPLFGDFYESKKYLKGTLFSLKMRYLNKQGQQASSKNWNHPDKVITR